MLDAHRVPITRRATHGEQTFFASRRCLSLPRHRPAREMEGHASAYLRPRPALIEPFRGGRLQFARPLKLSSSERPLRTGPLQMGNGDSPLAGPAKARHVSVLLRCGGMSSHRLLPRC